FRPVRRSRMTGLLLRDRWSLAQPRDPSRSVIYRLGGVGGGEPAGAIPKGLEVRSGEEKIIPSFRSRGTMLWRMLHGVVNGCLRKPSGNLPPVAAWNQSAMPGETTSGRAAGTWRIRGRECSRSAIPAKMDLQVLRRSAPFPRMDTACMTWPATYGSGAA